MQLQPTDALLVIDVQNDFMPGGALAVPDGDAIVPLINTLAKKFDHVILTQDWHPPQHISFATTHSATHPNAKPFETIQVHYGPQTLWPEHVVQHTEGAAFHSALHIPHAELILRKGFRRHIDSYSAFLENDHRTPTGLAGYLRERNLHPPLPLRPRLRLLCPLLRHRRPQPRLRNHRHRRRHPPGQPPQQCRRNQRSPGHREHPPHSIS